MRILSVTEMHLKYKIQSSSWPLSMENAKRKPYPPLSLVAMEQFTVCILTLICFQRWNRQCSKKKNHNSEHLKQ